MPIFHKTVEKIICVLAYVQLLEVIMHVHAANAFWSSEDGYICTRLDEEIRQSFLERLWSNMNNVQNAATSKGPPQKGPYKQRRCLCNDQVHQLQTWAPVLDDIQLLNHWLLLTHKSMYNLSSHTTTPSPTVYQPLACPLSRHFCFTFKPPLSLIKDFLPSWLTYCESGPPDGSSQQWTRYKGMSLVCALTVTSRLFKARQA